jgi:hypothetical protein
VIVVWFLRRTVRCTLRTSSAPPHRTRCTSWPVLDPSMTIFVTVALFLTTKVTPLKPMAIPTRSRPRPVCPPPAEGSPTSSTASTDAGCTAKRQRTLTSDVWHYLDALSKDVRGKPVMYGARCKFCKKELSGKSTSGTGHLLRHVKSCLRK